MPTFSSGLLLYRVVHDTVEVLLVHPGGPFWARRDDGAWSLPKGEHTPDEDALQVAAREFAEELGTAPPVGAVTFLGEVRQRGGKRVTGWAVEGDLDVTVVRSNTFSMEWPPRSGTMQDFPEIDRAAWFSLEDARRKLLPAQVPFIERLLELL